MGEAYTTIGAFRYGDYVGKVSVTLLSNNSKALVGKEVDLQEPSAYRDLVVEFFRT